MAKKSIFGVEHMKKIPPVYTVSQLRDLLSELPPELPLGMGGDGMKPIWMNVGRDSEHLCLEEEDEFNDDM